MTREEQWNRDTEIEQMAAQFLDANFYPMFKDKAKVTRHKDKYHQVGGVDISINDTSFDEKCKYQGLLNKVLATPGLECSINNKAGCLQVGWFLNDQLSTDYYSFISLSATVDDDRHLSSSSQITAADVLWVKKQDVIDYVESFEGNYGRITMKQLSADAHQLRLDGDVNMQDVFGHHIVDGKGRARYHYPHRKYWLTYSLRRAEKPVNLVVLRSELEQLPHTRHFIVTRTEVKQIKK